MLRANEKTIFSLILVVFTTVLLVEATGLRDRAALLPNLIGYPLLIGSLLLLLGDIFPAVEKKLKKLLFSGVNAMDGAGENETESLRGTYSIMIWMGLFVTGIYFLGVISGIFIALAGYLKTLAGQGWVMSLVYPTVFTLVVYLIFVQAMGVYYFTAPVFDWPSFP